MRIAVVGTGISGLVVAHHLQHRHDITVFESDSRVGGHAHTVDVEVDGRELPVDTGFIVCNDRTYPRFLELLDEIGVATRPSDMSFGVSDESTGIEYRATDPLTLFAQPGNLLRPRFHRMLLDIVRVNRALQRLDAHGALATDETLRSFVDRIGVSDWYVDLFLAPFGSAIWSADPTSYLDFPVATYARFMANHGLLGVRGQPTWRTIEGGSRTYVDALVAPFAHRIRTSTPVEKVVRRPAEDGMPLVEVVAGGERHEFDRVVLATHSDQALRLLSDPTPTERAVLGALRYRTNVATLHSDERFLPRARRARASWNVHVPAGSSDAPTLTYWMNRLQGLPTEVPVLVTLNRADDIDPRLVHRQVTYAHPVVDVESVAAQARRDEIQGRDGVWFAGAYWGYGFHEDGVRSGLDVVQGMAADAVNGS